MKVIGLILLWLTLNGAVCAQGVMTVEQLQARLRAQGVEGTAAAGILKAFEAGEARIDAAVYDIDSYVRWAKEFRESVLKEYYISREESRSHIGKPETKFNKGFNEIFWGYVSCYNQKINASNNPYEPFIPGVCTNKVIALDGTANNRYLQIEQIIDSKNARAKCV